jgi:hypothetical protein
MMNRLGKCAVFFVLFALLGSGAFGDEKMKVTGNAPTLDDTSLQDALDDAFDTALGTITDYVGHINAAPEKLIGGFATSSVYASQGAAQRGYGQPKLLTFTMGPMVGLQIGASLGDLAGSFENIRDDLKENGDITFGLNVQGISGQFNLNTPFLLDGLDLGLRFGFFNLPDTLVKGYTFGFKTFSVGVVGNYQLLKEKTIVPVLVKWRGLSLGTGLIFQNTAINFGVDVPGDFDVDFTGGTLKLDPKLAFNMKTNTFTIPLEAATAVQLFSFLNITLGAGADLAFGGNELSLGINSDIDVVDGSGDALPQSAPGSFEVSGGGKAAPAFFNFKIMTGIGFKIGPVILDVPVTLYPGKETGASIGVTLGFTL